MALAGKVALVTGASRGIGKGIAKELCRAGAKVYITGRTLKKRDDVPGSLEEAAEEAGPNCIPIQCDHANANEIKNLFERIGEENSNRLDILINNCFAGVNVILQAVRNNSKFFELDPHIWDTVNNAGLRAYYFANVYAARLMTPAKQGIIIHIGSAASDRYLFNTAFGVGKAGLKRLSSDCAHELKEFNVSSFVVAPGPVQTELLSGVGFITEGETPEMVGQSIVAVSSDPEVANFTGKVFETKELYKSYNLNVDFKSIEVDSLK